MAASDKPEATDLVFGMGALMSDLKRLEARALSQGFLIAATLIGAAAEAVSDELDTSLSNAAGHGHTDRAEGTLSSDNVVVPSRQRLQ